MKDLGPSGAGNLWAAVSMLCLATLSVGLRLALRLSAKLSVTLSDWLIILSLALLVVYTALMIQYIVDGPGPGTYDLIEITAKLQTGGMVWGQALLKMLYIADLFFGLTITAVKLSILAFYHVLFSISRRFHIWNYAVAATCIVWLIVCMFLNIFQCNPISALWEQLGSTEYCLPSGSLWLGFEVTNFVLDVVVLVLPVTMVRHLHLPSSRKLPVAGIFLMGGLVCVASIIRMVYIWNPKTPEVVSAPGTMILSSIQLGTAILCACLPTYGPLFKYFRRAVRKSKLAMGMSASETYASSRGPHFASASKQSGHRELETSPYYPVGENGAGLQETQIYRGDDDSVPLQPLPSQSIMVKSSVTVK